VEAFTRLQVVAFSRVQPEAFLWVWMEMVAGEADA
jgi:hypothetical protein